MNKNGRKFSSIEVNAVFLVLRISRGENVEA